MTLNEHKYAALLVLTGASSGSLRELERTWLLTETGATSGTLNELAMTWLASQGAGTGTVWERWYAYLGGLGYTGNLNERFYLFWQAGGPSGPSGDALQLESGDYLLLESGDYLLLE